MALGICEDHDVAFDGNRDCPVCEIEYTVREWKRYARGLAKLLSKHEIPVEEVEPEEDFI